MDINTEIDLKNKKADADVKAIAQELLKAQKDAEENAAPLFSNGFIGAVAAVSTTVGGWVGSFLGREAGLELGKELRKEAEDKIIESVNKTTGEILKDYNMSNYFTDKMIKNEVDHLVRRQIGDKIEDTCIDQGAQKGAALGSVMSAGATLLFMGGMNYGYSLYQKYTEDQSKARAEAVNAKHRQEIADREATKNQENNGHVQGSLEIEDFFNIQADASKEEDKPKIGLS